MRKIQFSSYLKTYFTFSKGERNGILVLLFILVVVIISIFLIPKNKNIKDEAHLLSLKNEVDSLFTNTQPPIKIIKAGYAQKDTFKNSKSSSFKIELNRCDSSELTKLAGIGPVYAYRIIKYRNLLGGFYNINQLQEVYGLNEETFLKIKNHITANKQLITAILIDTAGFKTLLRHPYIGKERTVKIINYRKKNPQIEEKALLSAGIFDSIQWKRVKPYIIFQTPSN